VPVPTIAAAIDARVLSSMKDERLIANKKLGTKAAASNVTDRQQFINDVHDALYASKICSYAQGMALIQAGSKEWNWSIDMREMARIWKAGCIIRAIFLDDIKNALKDEPELPNLLLASRFREAVAPRQDAWRRVVNLAATNGIAAPAFSASLAYYDSYRRARLPGNLIQAQRDFFGAHTYERNETPGTFVHTQWEDPKSHAEAS
jgi:6-phosphogluconate dehydrogenase